MTKCREITDILLVTDAISKRTISKAPIQYDTEIIDIGDISRDFRFIDPPLLYSWNQPPTSCNNTTKL